LFQLSDEKLIEMGAIITTKEILGQPDLWQQTYKDYLQEKENIENFLANILNKHNYLRVIFTGAGTSQYVGDTVQRSLTELGDTAKFRFESIATTDIVSSPQTTLEKDTPTLLVSFARSGNSPESIAAVDLVEQVVQDSYHMMLTCAKDGKLALQAAEMDNALLHLLPDASNDQGFAMTGSCTSMMLIATLIFSKESDEEKADQVNRIAETTQDIFAREAEIMEGIDNSIERVIYVGSGPLAALAREAQLKISELTAGKVATLFDSSMGFRHGPKSFVNEKTAIFVMVANNDYTRQYDLDVYEEVKEDKIGKHIIAIGENLSEGFVFNEGLEIHDAYLPLPMLAFAQVIALNTSILVNNTPDTPSATGTVNRVVKGVIIHSLEK
jgi:tagatose-6-phosphate ketose/aldose isomerase